MGTDIHGVAQRRTAAGWQDVPSSSWHHRDYQLFAALAGVRNGRGFAGIKTGDAIDPIAEPRGLPPDFEVIGDQHPLPKDVWEAYPLAKYYEPGEEGYGSLWMGDHSHSWLSADEILAWRDRAPIVWKTGVLARPEFEAWRPGSAPEAYCGGVSGPGVVIVDMAEAKERPSSHVRVSWHEGLRERLGYFFAEVERLRAEHGEVRLVFGFDS